MSSPAGLFAIAVGVVPVNAGALCRCWGCPVIGALGQCWALRRQRGEQSDVNVAYAIAFPLAGTLEDLYSFTCCPDSSVVERHLGKMEVPGSIPGRGSLINSCESTY